MPVIVYKPRAPYTSADEEIADRAESLSGAFFHGLCTVRDAELIARLHGTTLAALEAETDIRRQDGEVWGLDLLTALGY